MSTTASPAPTSPRAPTTGTGLPGYSPPLRYQPPQQQAQSAPAMGSGMRYRQQMPGSMGLGYDQTKFATDAERLISELNSARYDPNSTGYDPNESTTGQEFLSGRDMTITQGPYSGAFEVPIGVQPQQPIIPTPVGGPIIPTPVGGPIIPTPVGAQPQGKMGGGYPSAPVSGSPGPVSGDPGMAGGGMTPTTQPVGVAVPVDVEPFIAGQGEFMGGGSYGAPLRGSNIMPEDYANLYGGRFGRGR